MRTYFCIKYLFCRFREETEIIEGEVVEIQIDRPASGTVRAVLIIIIITIIIIIFFVCKNKNLKKGFL